MYLQNQAEASTSSSRAATERLLADIRGLAPAIIAHVAEMESERRIPLDLVEQLKAIGALRIFVPRSHGGLGLDLPSALEVIGALSRIDGSIGWTAMIASGSSAITASLPRETYERICGNGPMVIAGSSQPAGTAEASGTGWRVNGRWPFASGCLHADWLVALCVMTERGKPVPGPAGEDGPPLIRGFVLPARDWRIEDTWHVAGLKGTGSNHIALEDAAVPAANFFDYPDATPCLPGPLYKAVPQILPLLHGAFTVGMAEGALDDLIAHANTGRRQFRAPRPMRESEFFQGELGRVVADVRAARAFLRIQAENHWKHALNGTLKDNSLLMQGTQAGIWLATTCVRVADTCFALGGGSALYETSPLQRRLRDLHVAAQHAAVQQRHYVDAGKLVLDRSDLSSTCIMG
jgi:alkylation response protein AidB-like acyl-CoA dehydrogenase